MVSDDLVKRVVQEVIKKLSAEGAPKEGNPSGKRILAVFCGGAIGLRESLAEIRKLKEFGCDLQAVFTPAAERVIGFDVIKSYLGSTPIITEADGQSPGTLIKSTDMVVLPVLTLNSAAKLANGIADNLATTLVVYGLMFGKPVIAVRDACDLNSPMRTTLKMNRANQFYQQLTACNLNRLENYGITVVDSGALSTVVMGMDQKEGRPVPAEPREGRPDPGKPKEDAVYSRNVLTAGDLAVCKDSTIRISKKTLVTAMARDLARERGIEIISQ